MTDDICTILDCEDRKLARGWCSKHYQRWKIHGDPNYNPDPSRVRAGSRPTRFVTVGQRFGRWTVTGPEVRISSNRRAAPVKCSCPRGTEKIVCFGDLFDGNSKSCGCLRGERMTEMNRGANPAITHGMATHPLYHTWKSMVSRCSYPSDKDWPNYGGRGIKLCQEWRDLAVFVAWIEANIGPRPEGKHPSGVSLYTLDRIDNAGHYEPGNVQWATAAEQCHNRRYRPRKECLCGNLNPARAKFCFACGAALPEANP